MVADPNPQLRQVAGDVAPLLDRLTRFGFGVKGLVTVLVGVLALRYALGKGGKPTGEQGAIASLLGQPFGTAIVAVIAAGLAAYALWMFGSAIVDPERKGASFQGLGERVGFFVTGVAYALLSWAVVGLLQGGGTGPGLDLEGIASAVLTPLVGRAAVAMVGLAVVTAGILQLRLGLTGRFRRSLRDGLTRVEQVLTMVTGSAGYVALGVMSLLVGSSILRVAIEYDPSEAGGWDEALSYLSGLGQGPWALIAASTGLILYGTYFMLLVRYRRL